MYQSGSHTGWEGHLFWQRAGQHFDVTFPEPKKGFMVLSTHHKLVSSRQLEDHVYDLFVIGTSQGSSASEVSLAQPEMFRA